MTNVRRRRGAWLTLACLSLALALCGTMARAAHAGAPARHYYLALGDSLSVGVQPDGAGVPRETRRGYADDLERYEEARIPRLILADLGCPGETTTSMLTGKGDPARPGQCDRTGGSQLAAAEAFLRSHHRPGEVPLLTLDIGGNDIDTCLARGAPAAIHACVVSGRAEIASGLAKILAGLRAAAPSGTRFVAMDYYDPGLAFELSASAASRAVGAGSAAIVQSVNAVIRAADRHAGFATANVAAAFDTDASHRRVSYRGHEVPEDVARICDLTWMCAPAPVGPNLHPDSRGYAVIARAFESILRSRPAVPSDRARPLSR